MAKSVIEEWRNIRRGAQQRSGVGAEKAAKIAQAWPAYGDMTGIWRCLLLRATLCHAAYHCALIVCSALMRMRASSIAHINNNARKHQRMAREKCARSISSRAGAAQRHQ